MIDAPYCCLAEHLRRHDQLADVTETESVRTALKALTRAQYHLALLKAISLASSTGCSCLPAIETAYKTVSTGCACKDRRPL